MEENSNTPQDWAEKPFFPTGKKELAFGICAAVIALLAANSVLYGGFRLGFAVGSVCCVLASAGYLLRSGCRLTPYSGALLALSMAIAAAFGYSSDGFVKFVMLFFLLFGSNLGLCLLAKQNLRDPGTAASLADAFRAGFSLGMGKLSPALEGLRRCFRHGGSAGRKGGAVALGLLIALPVLAILVPLLVRADAAFDGLMGLLPKFSMAQLFNTLLAGTCFAAWLYIRGTALRHNPKQPPKEKSQGKGANRLTVDTVLGMVCFVYFLYLLSQTAYFAGGFSQILPQGYTMAGYARRGFFEMALLTGVNLCIISVAAKSLRRERVPVSTRLLCAFIGLVTLFLVVTASAKMFLYIGAFGLTRLRILTQAVMLWLGLTTLLVTVRLFLPRFGYMKAAALCAMVIGTALIWADVDTQVARHNVNAYLSGEMQTVDVVYLQILGDGAVPYLAKLRDEAPDAEVARQAGEALEEIAMWRGQWTEDFRGWSYLSGKAEDILRQYRPETGELSTDSR